MLVHHNEYNKNIIREYLCRQRLTRRSENGNTPQSIHKSENKQLVTVQAHMCQIGKWHDAAQLQLDRIPWNFGENPSSGFRDMCFSPWANPYWSNGQVAITEHNYWLRKFQRTSNAENMSSSFRYMHPQSLYPTGSRFHKFLVHGQAIWGKWAMDHDVP